MTFNKRAFWRTFVLIVCVVLPLLIVIAGCGVFRRAPPTPEPAIDAFGVQKFYRDAYFKGNVETAGDVIVGGAISSTTDLGFDGSITVTGDMDVAGGLIVTGATELRNTADLQGAVSNSIGDLNFSDSVTVTGDLDLTGGLVVTGTTELLSTLDAQGAVSDSTGDLTFTDNVSTTGTLDVAGNTNITGTLTLEAVAFSGPITFGTDAQVADGDTVAHGLGAIPAAVVVSPITSSIQGVVFSVSVSETDSTNFTVAITPVAASNNIGIHWFAGR